jgi:hypothetical protein
VASSNNEIILIPEGNPVVPTVMGIHSKNRVPFEELSVPRIYAYTEPQYKDTPWQGGYEKREGVGLIKVGYTTRQDVNIRVVETQGTNKPTSEPYELILDQPAIDNNGNCFMDHDVHKILEEKFKAHRIIGKDAEGKPKKTEWFECTFEEVLAAVKELQTGVEQISGRTNSFGLRSEQKEAVDITADYFKENSKKIIGKAPHFLWNAKMRFGKTFSAYKLAEKMNYQRIVIITYKADTKASWKQDLESHVDFQGWAFIDADIFKNKTPQERAALEDYYAKLEKPVVMFVTFQDALGTNKDGFPKEAHKFLNETSWDLCILDEYHFGSHREKARAKVQGEYDSPLDELVFSDDSEAKEFDDLGFSEDTVSLQVDNYLYLSGTPFRQLANGDFTEDQIFGYTYTDEQLKKAQHSHLGDNSPYAELPTMCMLTYKMPESIAHIAVKEGMNEFDLNTFFKAKEVKDENGKSFKNKVYKFENERNVQDWLNLIVGSSLPETAADIMDREKAPQPFSDTRLLNALRHMLWFLPDIASVNAMEQLLLKQTSVLGDYTPIVVAGSRGGSGSKALKTVKDGIAEYPRTITLTCGKLTTGVSVKEWTAIFMLRSLSTPESYFQAAFRVQTPWVIKRPDGSGKVIVKRICYVFDWAPNRALNQISNYSARMNSVDKSTSTEQKVEDFLNFFPVLCYDGYKMEQLEASSLLEIVSTGTSHSMLARRWQSPQLVNLNLDVLRRLLNDKDLVAKLEGIEAFRNLGKQAQGIINKEERLNSARKEKRELTESEKKEKKEVKKEKNTLRDKLIKFLTRIPAFMYLTDKREASLEDVILNLEKGLFKKVTGLDTSDFKMLKDLGVFNAKLMDEAIWSFRKFEEPSLGYAGNAHLSEKVGGFSSVKNREDI